MPRVSSSTKRNYVALCIQHGAWSPTDAHTYYWGGLLLGTPLDGTPGNERITMPYAGQVIAVEITLDVAGVLGSSEAVTLSLGVNNTNYTQLSNSLQYSTQWQWLSYTGLAIPFNVGDYLELREVCPTWVTNPTAIVKSGFIWVRAY